MEIALAQDGLEVKGARSTSGLRSTPESKGAKYVALRFYGVLTNDSQDVRFERSLGRE